MIELPLREGDTKTHQRRFIVPRPMDEKDPKMSRNRREYTVPGEHFVASGTMRSAPKSTSQRLLQIGLKIAAPPVPPWSASDVRAAFHMKRQASSPAATTIGHRANVEQRSKQSVPSQNASSPLMCGNGYGRKRPQNVSKSTRIHSAG